jgi:hypothetical protein
MRVAVLHRPSSAGSRLWEAAAVLKRTDSSASASGKSGWGKVQEAKNNIPDNSVQIHFFMFEISRGRAVYVSAGDGHQMRSAFILSIKSGVSASA